MLSALNAGFEHLLHGAPRIQQLTPLLIMPVMLPVFLLVPLAQQPNGVFRDRSP